MRQALSRLATASTVAMLVLYASHAAVAAEPVAFSTEVVAVLSKSGCNLGACHANTNGKGGFKLSLRGEDPAADYTALVRQVDQRRVNLLDPEASLILQKPTSQVVQPTSSREAATGVAAAAAAPPPTGEGGGDPGGTPQSAG